ncbi:MAG: complex I subunit 5 family protein [bacterium]|jgi:hydrogenase-4 component B
MAAGLSVLPLLGQGLRFSCSPLGLFFAFLAIWVWPWATLFSLLYLKHSEYKPRFFCCWVLTLVGCLGSFLAADLFTLYVFFELMSLASWALVIHEEDSASLHAGNTYLYLSLAAGLAILGAAFLLQSSTGSSLWVPQVGVTPPGQPVLTAVALLLFSGFGVKSGLFPLHFWLPQAHPVAPAPASAILSGVLLKVGAYGMLRSVYLLAYWDFQHLPRLGLLLVVLAAITMLWGALRALGQDNAKRLLAFSSVSQLGFVSLAVGLAALLHHSSTLPYLAALYHCLNHTLAKSALFLTAGALMLCTGSLHLNTAAGMGRGCPQLLACAYLGSAAMAGIPGVSGYVSKTVLHHAIVTQIALAPPAWKGLELIFYLAGAGTVAYYLKFLLPWFKKAPRDKGIRLPQPSTLLWLPILVVAAGTLLAGLAPDLFLNRVVAPVILTLTGSEGRGQLAADLAHLHPWSFPDLQGGLITLSLGISLYAAYLYLPGRLAVSWKPPILTLLPRSTSFTPSRRIKDILTPIKTRISTWNPLTATKRHLMTWSKTLSAGKAAFDLKPTLPGEPLPTGTNISSDSLFAIGENLLLIICRGAALLDAGLNRGGAALAQLIVVFFRFSSRIDDTLDALNRRLATSIYTCFHQLGHLEKAPSTLTEKESPSSPDWGKRFLHLDLLNLDVAVLLLALVLLLTLLYFLLQA